ncbi:MULTISPECIES: MBL fold metallo-hydrolase [Halorussus]|uniref:MBL fold metallo-hydrolase n=1 Tax=Halorussus TaxID=1070314 RepID=UPI00209CA350|nr:MBL fold metallo-hydrolase [Halorussus vallis]USZ75494.1 MBL fold metallo-hydrolase [Halorussus vallis]
MTIRHDGLLVDWLGYATLRIEAPGGPVVYLDPGRYGVLTGEWRPDSADATHPEARDYRPEDGDLVLVTHDHHYDSDGIERVAADDATVVVYDAVYPKGIDRDVKDLGDLPYEVVKVSDGTDRMFGDVIVRTVEAYNEPDGPHTRENGEPFHPEGSGTGYIVTVDGTDVFWPGDSDALDGHAALDVSLFCPPIGGSFTMDRREAADLAEAMDPDLVLPIHYDTFEALETDSAAFASDVASRGVPVVLDERE